MLAITLAIPAQRAHASVSLFVVVATPGRLIDHMKQSSKFASQQLSRVRHLILDEADRMLNMAFAEDIDMVLDLFQRPATAARKKRKKAKRLTILEQTAQAKGSKSAFSRNCEV